MLVVVMVAAVRSKGLTREDAMRVTNADVIQWLPFGCASPASALACTGAFRRWGCRSTARGEPLRGVSAQLPFLDRYGNVDLSGLGDSSSSSSSSSSSKPTEEGDEFGAFDDDDGSAYGGRRGAAAAAAAVAVVT